MPQRTSPARSLGRENAFCSALPPMYMGVDLAKRGMKPVLFSPVGENPSRTGPVAAPQPYPPAQHMLRDLRLEIWRRGAGVAVRGPAVPAVHNRAGSVG